MADPELSPDSTAVRVALWRALHVLVDPPPHVLEDEVGLRLVAPDEGWRARPDMNPVWTATFRAAIVARARFVEDLVVEEARHGARQYVILGAGLDTFAQRQAAVASTITVYEVDRPEPQAWKRQRLIELGYGVPDWLRLAPVNFEMGATWWDQIAAAGFDGSKPAVISSTGVTPYLTKEATAATLCHVASLVPGSVVAMTFLLPMDLVDADERPGFEAAAAGARASGTPFISLYSPEEMMALASECGLREVRHVSTAELIERYFAQRTDGLRPGTGEQLVVGRVNQAT
ncbi:MAG: class I SAM-dependent methyltransferase [Chloroflexi bacterium]|nr:class I SAM-dependent methyltransferase [Chloroflexota bacterium]